MDGAETGSWSARRSLPVGDRRQIGRARTVVRDGERVGVTYVELGMSGEHAVRQEVAKLFCGHPCTMQ